MPFLVFFIVSLRVCSTSGQPTTDVPYVCLPIGSCETSIHNTNTTPTRSPCPAGQAPCLVTTLTFKCGRRKVQNVSPDPGSATFETYPWLTFIMNQTGYTGVGVFIAPTDVLTAAHKVYLNVFTPFNIRVVLSMGAFTPENMTGAQIINAKFIRVHPNFTRDTLMNDIAVIRLATLIGVGTQLYVGTACLPPASPPGSSPYTGKSCTVAGWGRTNFSVNGVPTNPQNQVTVSIVTYQQCRSLMSRADLLGNFVDRYLDRSGEICAGGDAQVDGCAQDGGAPLVCENTNGQIVIAGLIIWGKKCGLPGSYGVYVSVPVYRDWLESVARIAV